MENLNIYNILTKGEFLPFDNMTNESDVIELLGSPSDIEDYGKNGKYLHFEDLRISIYNGKATAIELMLRNSEKDYQFSFYNEVISINGDTSMSFSLFFFNDHNIKWNIPYDRSKLDYLVIEAASGIQLLYYLRDGKLERISKFFNKINH